MSDIRFLSKPQLLDLMQTLQPGDDWLRFYRHWTKEALRRQYAAIVRVRAAAQVAA